MVCVGSEGERARSDLMPSASPCSSAAAVLATSHTHALAACLSASTSHPFASACRASRRQLSRCRRLQVPPCWQRHGWWGCRAGRRHAVTAHHPSTLSPLR